MVMLFRRVCFAQHGDGLVDLFGQFAGRGDDQGADLAAFALHQAVQDRQGECGGFAGAGLGQAHDVQALHDGRNALFLNRCRCGVAGCRNSGSDLGMKIECLEIHETPSFCVVHKKSPGVIPGLTLT